MWIKFEHYIDHLFSKVLLNYFYRTKVVQILYVTYHELNAMTCFLIYLLKDNLKLLSCVYIKKYFI
jgi:hypothetical protein